MSRGFLSIGRGGPRVGVFMPMREAAVAVGIAAIVLLPITAIVVVLNWIIKLIIPPGDESSLPVSGSNTEREYRQAMAEDRSSPSPYWDRLEAASLRKWPD
jgi:hypothetical protein